MKLAPKATADPRSAPRQLVIDDMGLARSVAAAPTPAEAWRTLGLDGERNGIVPAHTAAIGAAVSAVATLSDAIAKGLGHFGDLADDAPVPVSWTDRMVELHAQELVAYFDLDDLAYEGLRVGGWTATTPGQNPPEPDPVKRIAQRVRWEIEAVRPSGPALWLDRLLRGLEAQVDPAEARRVGLHVLGVATRRHFSGWHKHKREATR